MKVQILCLSSRYVVAVSCIAPWAWFPRKVNLLHGFTGGNQLAIVGSTLAIVILFQPLRRRIQMIIDRRFYRSKYDAARTLAAFSATLRNEFDLEQLSEQVASVIQETMQPTHVSLWLRQPERETKVGITSRYE